MKKDDMYGLGASVLLHLLLLLAFGVMSMAAVEPEPLGFIAVELGPISEGRPIQRAAEDRPQTEAEPEPQPEEEVQEEAAPPVEAKPVELPDQPEEIIDEEQVRAPEAETIAPVEQNEPREVVAPEPQPEVKPTVQPLGGGSTGGTTGATEGTPGPGEEAPQASPFNIEGLNRSPISAPLPRYVDKVNATIRMRITVNPRGQVVGLTPIQKGTPALDREVQAVLRRWRFNALPSNAPQVPQTGIVTFRFVVQ